MTPAGRLVANVLESLLDFCSGTHLTNGTKSVVLSGAADRGPAPVWLSTG